MSDVPKTRGYLQTLCGGGRTPAHALLDLAKKMHGARNAFAGHVVDHDGDLQPRKGEEMRVRVVESVDPRLEPRWVAEATWEPL